MPTKGTPKQTIGCQLHARKEEVGGKPLATSKKDYYGKNALQIPK